MKKIFFILLLTFITINLNANSIELKSDYYIEGNKVNLTISAKNLVANGKGGISISFPQFETKNRIIKNESIGFKEVQSYEKGKKIWNREIKKAVRSTYLLSEGWTKNWRLNEDKIIKLIVNAEGLSHLKVHVRTNVLVNKEEYVNPVSSDFYNQQGYYDKVINIKLNKVLKVNSISGNIVDQNEIYRKLIYPEIKNYTYSNEFFPTNNTYNQRKITNKDIIHTLEKVIAFDYDNSNEFLYFVSSTFSENECHVCSPKMSWFHVIKKDNKWSIKYKSINDEEGSRGTYGRLILPEIINIGKNNLALNFVSYDMHQGYGGAISRIKVYESGKFREIFSYESESDNIGALGEEEGSSFETKLTFLKSNKNFYDIFIFKYGVDKLRKFEIKEKYIYKNGKYIISK